MGFLWRIDPRADHPGASPFIRGGLVPTVVPRLRPVVGHFGPTRGTSLSIWTIAGRRLAALPGWRCGVNVQAADIAGFAHQVSGYVPAFYRGGNDVDDIVFGYAFQGFPARNKCVRFADRV